MIFQSEEKMYEEILELKKLLKIFPNELDRAVDECWAMFRTLDWVLNGGTSPTEMIVMNYGDDV